MRLKFTKMEGLGNDFVVIDATAQPVELTRAQLRLLADRHFGVGCDQILQVEAPRDPAADFYYRIFNADGGEVGQCGNGARCFVRFVRDHRLTEKREIRVQTREGIITPRLEDDGQVTVDMGAPIFEPARVPFLAPEQALTYRIPLPDRQAEVSVLSMGNPHAVEVVQDVGTAPVGIDGPRLECHPLFPERVNAGFMQVLDRRQLRLRVFERGAGETLACGTGACAAAVAGISRGLVDSPVRVRMRGGDLTIAWAGEASPVLMTGPARTVFEGSIELQ
jgi:diaminopimelate epimerase